MQGFSLLELMVVIAIMMLLTLLAVPNYKRFIAKSKRAECHLNLAAIATAEELYHAEHGEYSDRLQGANSIGFTPLGSTIYSYGFAGKQGINWIAATQGKSEAMPTIARVTPDGFVVAAVADIDGDGIADIVTIDQRRVITIVQDDLQ